MAAEPLAPSTQPPATSAVSFRTQVKQAPGRLKDSLVAELAVAVAWVMAYVKGGRTWDGLARLALDYHWPQAAAFRDLVAPGLEAHAQVIALACPFALTLFAYCWNWPIGSYVLFCCGAAYSYLSLGGIFYLAAAAAAFLGWGLMGRRNPPKATNFVFTCLLATVVLEIALYL
jgi:hypothetical protein